LQSIRLSGFLSFPPDSPTIELGPLNVLIGPNGSGKSNLLEAFELLRATPTGLAAFLRAGGTALEWVWKGQPAASDAAIDIVEEGRLPWDSEKLHYFLRFTSFEQRMFVLNEGIEDFNDSSRTAENVQVYYSNQKGRQEISVAEVTKNGSSREPMRYTPRQLEEGSLRYDESVLSQFKDSLSYPQITWLGREFARIQTFRNWTFGRAAPLRRPQPGDLPIDSLLDNSDNLGLVLNELQISGVNSEFNRLLSRFLPRYDRFSTRIQGNTVQFFLHEKGLGTPVPATRLSDGTIRFMAILAVLLSPSPPPLVTIEEPELGLHPDAVGLLADIMVEASSRMQIVATTHSDAFISALTDNAGSVLVCENLCGTTLERIDPAKLKFWLEKYRLGEIWRIGEIGGNP
jgi:predicted ATPase